jgi:hypothetical protein
MAMTEIQIPKIHVLGVDGGAFEAKIYDPTNDLSSIITDTQTFSVECNWYLEGGGVAALAGASTWELQVVFESLGAGPDGLQQAVPFSQTFVAPNDPVHPNRANYSGTVPFPVGTLPLGGANQPRAYHLTALLTSKTGGNPAFFAASYDLGIIQVVNA